MRQVQFDATLKYNESKQLYRPVTHPAYVGEPTPEIDAAWKDLLGGKYHHIIHEHAMRGSLMGISSNKCLRDS
jgi:hypothetical protein